MKALGKKPSAGILCGLALQPSVGWAFDTFFTDEGLGGKQVPEALRNAGEQVERHADHFPSGTADVEWLAAVAQKGWLVLTKDEAIGRNPLEAAVVKASGACVFALTSQDLTGPQMAAVFVAARHRIKQFAHKHQGPFLAKVYRDGSVKPWKMAEDLYRHHAIAGNANGWASARRRKAQVLSPFGNRPGFR